MPQWVARDAAPPPGMATSSSRRLLRRTVALGEIKLPDSGIAPAGGTWQPIELPFDEPGRTLAENGRLLAVRQWPPAAAPGLLEL